MLDEKFYDELMEFVESGPILEPSDEAIDIKNIKFIDSIDDAEELVTQQECDHCELSWIELRAEKIMDVLNDARSRDPKLYAFVKKDLESYRSSFGKAIYKRKLKVGLNSYAKESASDLTSDLFDILVDHTVYGNNSNFYRLILKMYKSGLWPCGWEGELPNEQCTNGLWLVFRSPGHV